MALMVRDATIADVDDIFGLGQGDVAFRVSESISFYEREELVEWTNNPKDNVLCVAEDGGRVIGFFFCKVMSRHWAMLDNFYCVPSKRDGKIGEIMLNALKVQLQQRGIVYLSTLIEESRPSLQRFLRRSGFAQAKRYEWHEMFINYCNIL